jgi:hypothetical protein
MMRNLYVIKKLKCKELAIASPKYLSRGNTLYNFN